LGKIDKTVTPSRSKPSNK